MTRFAYRQVDVFSATALKGNPLGVVIGADGLSDRQMAAFANWTNLSETTFLLEPTTKDADYRVRIFTVARELPFAGHPTLGTCHVWLAAGGKPRRSEVVQECGAGLIRLRRDGTRLAFAAPPLKRSGAVEADVLALIARALRIAPGAIHASNWVDNGPGFVAVLLASRAEVLALKPDFAAMGDIRIGVVGPWQGTDGTEAQLEVRAFVPGEGVHEDPVTGSLNAGLGQWLIGAGIAPERYVAAQGTALGRAGRVHVEKIGEDVWVGGETVTCIEGTVTL
ncbi:MAG: PhzF family phenazine biosynthesis protein [Alphaproteobacteria bacterium]|nr:PhzF family phenazine biosynthesis protein [Alphaproteobacteria bacterium]